MLLYNKWDQIETGRIDGDTVYEAPSLNAPDWSREHSLKDLEANLPVLGLMKTVNLGPSVACSQNSLKLTLPPASSPGPKPLRQLISGTSHRPHPLQLQVQPALQSGYSAACPQSNPCPLSTSGSGRACPQDSLQTELPPTPVQASQSRRPQWHWPWDTPWPESAPNTAPVTHARGFYKVCSWATACLAHIQL